MFVIQVSPLCSPCLQNLMYWCHFRTWRRRQWGCELSRNTYKIPVNKLKCFLNLHVLSTEYIYVFCVDLRTNSDYFPIQIIWFVFVTEPESVCCAGQTETWNFIQGTLSLTGLKLSSKFWLTVYYNEQKWVCKLIVAYDTTHLSALALSKPCIGLYGPGTHIQRGLKIV
jgi:hypothetical protein